MCRKCGGEMRDEWNFCPNCGAKKLAPARERREVVSSDMMKEDWATILALPFSDKTRVIVEELSRCNRTALSGEYRTEINQVLAESGSCYRVVVNRNAMWCGDRRSETIYMICKTQPKP
jgi:hypothetical protein